MPEHKKKTTAPSFVPNKFPLCWAIIDVFFAEFNELLSSILNKGRKALCVPVLNSKHEIFLVFVVYARILYG